MLRISKCLTAYTVIGLYVFFFVTLCFCVNMLFDLSLEVFSPFGTQESDAWQRHMHRFVTVVLFVSLFFNCTVVLSLFWDVITAFYKENRVWYFWVKLLFCVVDIVAAGIWCGVTSTNFFECLFLFTFFKAVAVSLFGSVFLLMYVYTKRNKKLFPVYECSWGKAIYLGTLFVPLMYLCPIFYIVSSGSAFFSIMLAFLLPYFSYLFIVFLFFRGSRKEEEGFLLRGKVILMMVLIFAFLISVFASADNHCGAKGCQLGFPSHARSTKRSLARREPQSILGYQMCGKRWGPLTLTDMVFFADLAYKTDYGLKNVTDIYKDYFKYHYNLRWNFVHINTQKPSFYHIRDSKNKINVIAIRGTTDVRDWVENGKIWNEVLVFQALISFLPWSSLIPLNVVANYISYAAILDYAYSRSDRTYIDALEYYLNEKVNVKNKRRTEDFYLVGHSLGGGLAKIVGSRLKLQAVSISSPGEMYNHKKYSYTLDDLQKYTASFGSRDDFISWLDKPGGLVQKVRKESGGDPFKAHSIEDTYCDIKKKCQFTTQIPCK